MPKGEIGWRRVTAEGERVQVYARRVGGEWRFFVRSRRYERWIEQADPPLEDWLKLLDAVQRRVTRRLFEPQEIERIRRTIIERFPDAVV
ncbi:MAG: hypothetical protein RMH97_00310 [Verrucomicrobiales bacterium]|nr:hypothetical protein [Verrucomicrobiales bacterium]